MSRPRKWTRVRAVAAVQAWAHAHGRPPQTRDFHEDPILPSVSEVWVLGYTIRTLRQAAWLDPQARRRKRDDAPHVPCD